MSEPGGTGRFQATREGFGFILPDHGGADLFVPPGETQGALHRDRVTYRITEPARGERRSAATIVGILERGCEQFTAVVAGRARHLHLVPDHPLLPPLMRLVGPRDAVARGQRVLCRLHDARPGKTPAAMVARILGDADDPRVDAEIVRTEFGLPGPFSPDVLAAAAHEAGDATARRDFRGEVVFTIDPEDARDFDDAVSLRREADGAWLLRVHIADVAAAVPWDGVVDQEARRRGNSTYLPGEVIHMLPPALSTQQMSLAPKVPKRVMSISVRLAPDGRVLGFRIDEGLIRSRRRLTYREVQQVLTGEGRIGGGTDRILREMDRMAQQLRARRLRRGGFDLQVPEVKVTLDPATGRPARIERRLSERSHQIIEEFMVLANRLACAFVVRRGHPYLFRVHRAPDPVAFADFCADVRTLAPEVTAAQLRDLPSVRRWIGSLPREVRTWRIHALLLRAFMHAEYAAEDTGHFGLGLSGYGHFTSPIRRYPDLFNHRLVKWAIRHGRRPAPRAWREAARDIARACTGTEERSEQAERSLQRIKILRWAEMHLGSIHRGSLSAILPRGFFVEFDDLPVEGLVPRDEAEVFWHQTGALPRVGSGRGGLQVGLPVIVQIVRVDLRTRSLLLALRAMGRRALDTDPERLDPLAFPWSPDGRRSAPGRRRGARRRQRRSRR